MKEKSNGVCCFPAYWYRIDRFGPDLSALFLFTVHGVTWGGTSVAVYLCLPHHRYEKALVSPKSCPLSLFIPGKEVAGAGVQGWVWRSVCVGLFV